MKIKDTIIFIRGAGELASACAVVLHRVGFRVFMSELEKPLAIRRNIAFSDVMYQGKTEVEGIQAEFSDQILNEEEYYKDRIYVFKDDLTTPKAIKPDVLIDGRMLKKNIKSHLDLAEFVVGLGPGFEVGGNCHVIVETKRGHDLGRLIYQGQAAKNTGIPGKLGGESKKRVVYALNDGKLEWYVNFGELVTKDQVIGKLDHENILSPLDGMVRGLIAPQVKVTQGLKIADVDPRGQEVSYNTISDKAQTIGRACLEAILVFYRE